MTRYNHQGLDTRSEFIESAGIDALIRPCIHKAFPLPAEDHASDDRFRLLLDALAQRSSRTG
ncbi:hypothetical protein FHG66_19075 [Rubellimicrobium rubrum]|uniref:Uncharacterized protein n=1 Tax=Rubellimicrobium rubrum TaxID=2585369 RepID=A0A5C4MRP2_9RHOB|nr:hypothetical protein [Rubellimicrobium rubrum]TNC46441.1 hypothetical protein FHG66_19075 [Rubellimicrobium rubrum]